MTRSLRVLLPLLLLCAVSASAQLTTGALFGTVTDNHGDPLPGVTVTVTGATGPQVQVTDPRGIFRYPTLAPGTYALQASLEGFSPVRYPNIVVNLGRTASLDITLTAALSEEITVTAAAPLIDRTSTSISTNFDTQAIETLPTGRNYSSIVQIAPGVSTDANPANNDQDKITVYGSSGAENAFYVDGVNTTNMEYGFQGKELNFEFIQEVDVKTGGYEAEFGRSTGGIINVITKSGTNELAGDVFGYYDSDTLQADAKTVVSTVGTIDGFTRRDVGFDAGGPIIRDKLFFFGAYDTVHHTKGSVLAAGPRAGKVETSESDRDLASAKLTYNFAPSQSLVFTFLQDPRTDTGAINDGTNHTLNGDPTTYLGEQEFGGRDYALRYDGVVATNWVLSAQAAQHNEKNSVGPESADGDVVQFRDARDETIDVFNTGGFGLIQKKNFDRKHYGASAMRILGTHEIKGGLEYEHDKAEVIKRMSGGQQVDILEKGGRLIYKHFYWTTPDATIANAPTSQLNASPAHKVTTAFLQDRWSVNDKLVLTYGVRWDKQQIIDASGVVQIDLDKDFAPRLGFVFDPSGRGTQKLYGSFGRFYEEIPMDLVIRSYSYERQPRIFNFSPTSLTPDPLADDLVKTDSAILGGLVTPADPDLQNQYLNEVLLGYEREVMPNVSVGVKGIYRKYGQVIEDFLCADDGTYCIGNPGEGLMQRVFALDYVHTFPAPKARRTFKGVQVDATKRFSKNWQAIASYLYSHLDGNFDGEYAPFTNVGADPNITAAYDYFDFFTDGQDLTKITNDGPLSNDRRHQFKASGVYNTPWKLEIGASAYWRSGTPVTRYGYSDAYGRYEFFLTKRGAEGRTPSNYDVDLHFGYPLTLGRADVRFLLDVFSVLNTQRAVLLDQRWAIEDEAGNEEKVVPPNPHYKDAVLRTPPTSVRFGVRFTF
ncbi:MAG TPA: TonB-dependent receptor [Thermoanaerobaculia bacterium]|nr:TonB-dependent receptor [Thermoanaerobaculia bacterium]